jgi:hypothetical protein
MSYGSINNPSAAEPLIPPAVSKNKLGTFNGVYIPWYLYSRERERERGFAMVRS